METIKYEDLDFIKNEKYLSGSYGKIEKCIYDGKEYVCKSFFKPKYLNEKRKKINLLSDIDKEGLITPKFWVDKQGNKNRYLTNFCNGKDIDFLREESYNVKLKLLSYAKQLILTMHKENIIHTDLSLSNLLYSNNNVSIIDFDNCSYKGYYTNIKDANDYCQEFIKTYGIKPELDIFMFNLMSFYIINEENSYYMIRNDIWINEFGIFDNPDGRKICKSLFLDSKVPNKDFLIDTIDETSLKI